MMSDVILFPIQTEPKVDAPRVPLETPPVATHAPTVQVKARRRGDYVDYEPANPLAHQFARLVKRLTLTEEHLAIITEMGMVVERRSV